MGRSKLKPSDAKYVALDLNEENVQEIYSKCLATKDSKEITRICFI